MDKKQQVQWVEAQKIVISEDLVDVAKKQLNFLAAVDRHRCLYDGPVLGRAIFRYKNYWLPMLAKHSESDDVIDGPLAVPLDCEWIWHCHRLNPLRYKSDCEEFYGRILDSKKVISSTVQGSPKQQTEDIWSRLYPEEPYELDFTVLFVENSSVTCMTAASQSKSTEYDLVDAVKRQSTFFYQVSRPSMIDTLFLEGAAARYKGFLHLIRRNMERSIRHFCVPTYDIDLIWHSHQLNPVSYCKDMVETLGKVLEHDDTDSDRTKGQKLDVGFRRTTKQWEETFGSRYWRAGAMYRNAAPPPVTTIPWKRESKSFVPLGAYRKKVPLSRKLVVEVLLEIVAAKNLPETHNGNLFVVLSKKKPDPFFGGKIRLSILSESREKQVASFQCEPTGELFLELMFHSPSSLPMSKPSKAMGTALIPLDYMMDPNSKLSVEEWFKLESSLGTLDSNPICLRVGVSISVPAPAPHVLELVRSSPFLENAHFFSLPESIQHSKSLACVIDEIGNEIINIQMSVWMVEILKVNASISNADFTTYKTVIWRFKQLLNDVFYRFCHSTRSPLLSFKESKNAAANNSLIMKREIVGVVKSSGETRVLAEFVGTTWYLVDSDWSSKIKRACRKDGHIFELSVGDRAVKLYPGRKLEYEVKSCGRHDCDRVFITAVEFSTDNPYGKAIALLDLKSGVVKVNEDWFVLSAITLNFLLSNILRKEGYDSLIADENNPNTSNLIEDDECDIDIWDDTSPGKDVEVDGEANAVALEKGVGMNVKSGVCVECGNIVNSGGCGTMCGGMCGPRWGSSPMEKGGSVCGGGGCSPACKGGAFSGGQGGGGRNYPMAKGGSVCSGGCSPACKGDAFGQGGGGQNYPMAKGGSVCSGGCSPACKGDAFGQGGGGQNYPMAKGGSVCSGGCSPACKGEAFSGGQGGDGRNYPMAKGGSVCGGSCSPACKGGAFWGGQGGGGGGKGVVCEDDAVKSGGCGDCGGSGCR